MFAMQGATTGWISVGFTDTPFMTSSDVVVGWVDDTSLAVTCLDSWSPDYNQPNVDTHFFEGSSDIRNISASQQDGKTTIVFTRNITSKDPYDYSFPAGGFFLTYALGASDGFGTAYAKHVEANSQYVSLFPTTSTSAPITTQSNSSISTTTPLTPNFVSPNGDMKVWWTVSSPNITVTAWAATSGYISVGFASAPFMTNADVYTVCLIVRLFDAVLICCGVCRRAVLGQCLSMLILSGLGLGLYRSCGHCGFMVSRLSAATSRHGAECSADCERAKRCNSAPRRARFRGNNAHLQSPIGHRGSI